LAPKNALNQALFIRRDAPTERVLRTSINTYNMNIFKFSLLNLP